jgi:hypothetical protein
MLVMLVMLVMRVMLVMVRVPNTTSAHSSRGCVMTRAERDVVNMSRLGYHWRHVRNGPTRISRAVFGAEAINSVNRLDTNH